MAYIPDNTVCRYFPIDAPDNLLAIGWLDGEHAFTHGPMSREFFIKLLDLLRNPWEPICACGYHTCEVCRFSEDGMATFDGRTIPGKSAANLYVPYQGVIYVAPELIAHYIDSHRYRPPDIFIEAVLACPPTNSMAYKKALLENGGRSLLKAAKA
jgi:hypothetical protein